MCGRLYRRLLMFFFFFSYDSRLVMFVLFLVFCSSVCFLIMLAPFFLFCVNLWEIIYTCSFVFFVSDRLSCVPRRLLLCHSLSRFNPVRGLTFATVPAFINSNSLLISSVLPRVVNIPFFVFITFTRINIFFTTTTY